MQNTKLDTILHLEKMEDVLRIFKDQLPQMPYLFYNLLS